MKLTRRSIFKAAIGAVPAAAIANASTKGVRAPTRPHEFLTDAQAAVLASTARQIELFGGWRRGTGRSYAAARWLVDKVDDPKYRGLLLCDNVRATGFAVDRLVNCTLALFAHCDPCLHSPSRGTIHTAPIERWNRYRGMEFDRIAVDVKSTKDNDAQSQLESVYGLLRYQQILATAGLIPWQTDIYLSDCNYEVIRHISARNAMRARCYENGKRRGGPCPHGPGTVPNWWRE